MSQRPRGLALAAAALIALAAATAPAFSAEGKAATPTPPAATPPAEGAAAGTTGAQTVETILRQQEALLSGQQFSYDPGGRRDPFRSLLEELNLKKKGPRPKGVAGMLVTEVDLVGIVKDPSGGNVAFVMGSDNKGYFLKAGDEVYDGAVIAVDPRAGTVTFRQQVDDPRLIKPYRDVVKRLVPLEEERPHE